jgi:hypothetical protein
VLIATYPATSFAGKAYATTYYLGFDTATEAWTITTDYSEVTGDTMIVFAVRTHDSNGVTGAGSSGGGSGGDGGTGGSDFDGGSGGGFGRLR